uniref:non-specific serine/threonine protein kinase n=1 Tax=Kalanchoe fedtschenkoi TaxID=63787 RepID=A0A7N0TIN5_KALFE
MDGTQDDAGHSDQGSPNAAFSPSNFSENFRSVSLASQEESLIRKDLSSIHQRSGMPTHRASQTLWNTGMLSDPIPNGFYSVSPEKHLKDLFHTLPTLEELSALGDEIKADIILVDSKRDKKLSMLKQLIVALVKGLNSNPAAMIKKIAGLVSDFYKRPNSCSGEFSGTFKPAMNPGVQLLGQIKHGSCRPRAILFKVLADNVGLESKLIVGLPNDGSTDCFDSNRHMSVTVLLNSVEVLVDLMRFPGQLIPHSTKAIFFTHISAAGESDSAENDSCDSPLEPNSPLFGFSERHDTEKFDKFTAKDESIQYQRKSEASTFLPGPSMRNFMQRSSTSSDRKLSLSHSEPNIATAVWRRNRRKIIAEQRTASSSPEHPSYRERGRSMLSGDRKSFANYATDAGTSRSDGASTLESRRLRRRSISITPEIGDHIVSAVRAMNEKLKQTRHFKEQHDSRSSDGSSSSGFLQNVADFPLHSREDVTDNLDNQRAISLPSSPHAFGRLASDKHDMPIYRGNNALVDTWNKVLESDLFNNKSLLPYEEWNIDFTELSVKTRVGIGFFGEVFHGMWNGTEVAIKVFLEQDLNAENMKDFCNEISILSRLRHPNVILFLGACTKPPHLSMITEYMDGGSLYNLIHLGGFREKFSWRRRLKILRDICRGLMCIHRMKIVHRDIKSANCLVNKHWVVKICDFGLSRIMTETPMRDSAPAGTPEWMAPELIRNEHFTETCDIFSFGVIMWELCTLNRPWDGVPQEKVIYAVANEGLLLDIPSGPLGKLISDCWAEPHERPSCAEILACLVDCENLLC